MINTNLFKSKMVLYGDTVNALAESLGISRTNLSNKINNKLDFNNKETAIIMKRYELTPQELIEIFGLTNERD